MGLVGEEHAGRVVDVDAAAHVHDAGADPEDERRSGARELVQDERRQHLGVGDGHAGGERRRALRARRYRRREDERHAELGTDERLVAGDVVEHERR